MPIVSINYHLRLFSAFVRIYTARLAPTSAKYFAAELWMPLSTSYPQLTAALDFPASYGTLPARLPGST
jgi:hypothetical protein